MNVPDKAWLLARVGPSRAAWAHSRRPHNVEPVGPGEESVWDFPRPPRVEDVSERVRVVFNGETVADTFAAKRICETASAPAYHIPPEHVAMDKLRPVDKVTACEWKGFATYFNLVVNGRVSHEAAYTYPDPLNDLGEPYPSIAGWPVFYASRVDAAYVGEAKVRPQPGGYYSGWVTPGLRGPIKGLPGTESW